LLRRFFNASIFLLAEQQDAADGPCMGVKDVGFFPPLILGVGPSRCAADSTARVYYQAFNIRSFIVVIIGQPALHVCRLIISSTLWEAMKTMEQAFLLIIEANRKGNLKSGRIYLP
jgi:hypothetical protein